MFLQNTFIPKNIHKYSWLCVYAQREKAKTETGKCLSLEWQNQKESYCFLYIIIIV